MPRSWAARGAGAGGHSPHLGERDEGQNASAHLLPPFALLLSRLHGSGWCQSAHVVQWLVDAAFSTPTSAGEC